MKFPSLYLCLVFKFQVLELLLSFFLSQGCEHHFKPFDMVNTTSYTDATTSKVIEVTLKLAQLRPDAVLSILPDCPEYLSAPNANTSQEAPDEKRTCRKAAALQDAISKSIETHQTEDKNKIDNFQALLQCLPCIKVSEFWTVISQHDYILFRSLSMVPQQSESRSPKTSL